MDATASNVCMELLRGMTTTAILTYLDTSNVLMLQTTVTLSLWSTFTLLFACDIKCKLFDSTEFYSTEFFESTQRS